MFQEGFEPTDYTFKKLVSPSRFNVNGNILEQFVTLEISRIDLQDWALKLISNRQRLRHAELYLARDKILFK